MKFDNLLKLVNHLNENKCKVRICNGIRVYPEHLFTFLAAYMIGSDEPWWYHGDEIYPQGMYDDLHFEVINE